MKITATQLRRIIREEVRRVTEATRSAHNLEADLEAMAPGDSIDEFQLFTPDGRVTLCTLTKREATPEELDSYDSEDETGTMYTLTSTRNGRELLHAMYPNEFTSFFAAKGWEFAY